MQKIVLNVLGTQKVDAQRDKMELTTIASFEENDTEYIIKYNEEQEPPLAAIKVCVTIKKDESFVEMTRTGAQNSCLTIESSKRNLCHYGTEYGDILMGISGHSIDLGYENGVGEFVFAYDIDINGALVSKNEVKLNFKTNQE